MIDVVRLRLKFVVLVTAAVASALSGWRWSTLALAVACVGVPVAVAGVAGWDTLRALFFLKPRIPPEPQGSEPHFEQHKAT